MPSRVNRMMVKETVERYRPAGCMVAVAYEGLSAKDDAVLRRKLREGDVAINIVKNRVARIAFGELGREDFSGFLDGETAVIACNDPVGASKAAVDFARERKLKLKGGWAEGKTLTREDVMYLAAIPPRNVLLGQIAGLAAAPLARLVGMISAPYASIARALKAWNEKREGAD